MKNKIRILLPLLGLALLGGLALWSALARHADQPDKTKAAQTAVAPSVPTPPPAPAVTGNTAATPALAAPAIPAGSGIWTRLATAKVIESHDRMTPDGKTVRITLIDYPGKYPHVLVRETIVTDAQNRPSSLQQVAMVADHMLVQQAKGVSAGEFERALAQAGMSILAPMTTEGLYMVSFGTAGIDSLDQAMGRLAQSGPVAFAEPDFIVSSSDLVEKRQVILQGTGGIMIDPVTARAVLPDSPADAPTVGVDPEFVRRDVQKRLDFMPAGTRLLTFDPPSFGDGVGSFSPYLVEQNFKVSQNGTLPTDRYVYVQNALNSGYPNDGTYYARSSSGQFDFTVQHVESLPFTAVSVDLAEFSTSFAAPKSIIFTGYKAAGGTVTQTFTTDGVIDGTGSAADFQTFSFNSSFTGLSRLVANSSSSPNVYMIDNIGVLVEGAESTPVPPPADPIIYQVTWDSPKHSLNQVTEVSGPYAPSSINFGTPRVRSSVGTMAGPALAFVGGLGDGSFASGYQQIQFNLGRHAQLYRIEFDAYLDQPDEFKLFVDDSTTGALVTSVTFTPGSFPDKTVFHARLDLDMSARTTRLYINGTDRGSYGSITAADLKDFRLHLAGTNAASQVGIDNVLVTASGTISSPGSGPVLSAPTTLSYPSITVGTFYRATLNLANTGGQNLTINSITSSNPAFHVVDTFPITLLSNGTYAAKVDFTPLSAGPQNATLAIASNDPSQPTKNVTATATAVSMANVTLTPTSLSLTLAAGATAAPSVTIGNIGPGTLLWSLIPDYAKPTPGPAPDAPVTPSDTYYSLLYGLKDPGVTGAGIDATHAWAITTGSAAVKVAIIDSGVDPTHPDLAANVDTANGWNFINGTNNPMDDNGHGTHVAGTIAAVGNNGLGVTGVAWNCKVVALKFLDAAGNGFTSDAINAVNYAAARSIRITSNSWGGGGYSQSLHDAIQNSGALFVAAAGNSGTDNDAVPAYPAGFESNNLLAVAATDSTDTLASFSQYGVTSVDLAAPGVSIASTYPGNSYAYMSGTSMATPHVSGAAALLLSHDPTLSPLQMKQLLMSGTDPRPGLAGKMVTGGRLNLYTSLRTTAAGWITAPTSNGSVLPGQNKAVAFAVDTHGLAAGIYSQAFYLDSNDAVKSHVLFPVSLQVIAASAQLTITLTPGTGQWRVDGGAWQVSGATVTGLTAGNHTVDYNSLAGYSAPATESVALASGQALSLNRSYTALTALLTVTLTPGTGQWRVDGGAWQASAATVAGLAVGSHTIEYNSLVGYSSPASESIILTAGQSLSLSRSYTALPAQLTVTLTPAAGQWRVDGGAWRASGATVTGLTAGNHTVDYNSLAGYTSPATETVTLAAGQSLSLSRSYASVSGPANLTVNLTPANGQWRIDGSSWRGNGVTIYGITPGSHLIEYNDVNGYSQPPAETVTLPSGDTSLARSYTQLAIITVNLSPAGAKWRLDGSLWRGSGFTFYNVSLGAHLIEYYDPTEINALAPETITLGSGALTLSRTLVPAGSPAQLTITLTPGAGQWRVDGGAWQASGATVTGLTAGSHTVDYNSLAGYTSPASETVTLTSGQSLSVNRSYTSLLAQLTITLTPGTGQWRVDGGAWQASGATVSALAPGSHAVEFSPISGYTSPVDETVTLVAGQSLALNRNYAVLPTRVIITLTPDSGQWRVDGGAWQASGATVSGLAVGSHTVEYSSLPGYTSPPTESIFLSYSEYLAFSRSYVALAPAQLTVTLTPASGQWRIDGGVWRAGGTTLTGIVPGTHTVEYQSIGGYFTPATEDVTLLPGEARSLNRTYDPLPASLTINFTPAPAGAKWSLDDVLWLASGEPLGAVAPGTYTIHYATVYGYTTPPSETITLSPGSSRVLNRVYGPPSSQLTITLTPATGQWRLNGGAWQDSGATLSGLSAVSYPIDYSSLPGYSSPASEYVTLGEAQSLSLSRSYTFIPLGSVTVNVGPTGILAQWRLDGGAWQDAGTTLNEVSIGLPHTVEFLPVTGYVTPGPQTFTLASGEARIVTGIYTPASSGAQLSVSLNPTRGQWRLDGGEWRDHGALVTNVSAGSHTLDYRALPNFTSPPPETVMVTDSQSVYLDRAYVLTPTVQYSVTDLGSLGGPGATNVTAVNLHGMVTGTSHLAGGPARAFLFRDGAMQPLGTLGGDLYSLGYGLNDDGEVVGMSYSTAAASRPFVYRAGVMQDLGSLGGSTGTAFAITNTGFAVGSSQASPTQSYAFIHDGVIMLSLGSLGGTDHIAYAINEDGVIVGAARVAAVYHAFRWRNGVMEDINPLLNTSTSYAYGINEAGTIVGIRISSGDYRAFSLTADGVLQDLGRLGSTYSYARAINGSGYVVGNSSTDSGNHAFLHRGTGIEDLNHLVNLPGVVLEFAEGINDLGQIAANGSNGHAYLLTPTNAPGGLQVDLTPSTGQWRVDGGTWQSSGTPLLNLTVGSHTVEYSNLPGYTSPATETATVSSGSLLKVSRSYATAPPAQLTISLIPATGQWRVDGGTWQSGGATVTGLIAGSHTVDYNAVSGYTSPPSETVTLTPGQSLSLSRSYSALTAQLTLTLTPSSGQWRVDGGAWQPSGTTVTGLIAGSHTVDYNAVSGYSSPAPETVTLTAGQSLSLSRNYTVISTGPADLTINLTPANGQWRIDGSPFRGTTVTLYGLTPGSHLIEYNDVNGYAPPASETVTLLSGSNTLSRAYTELAIITVNLTPAGVKWRLDGSLWRGSGFTFYNVPLGSHLLEYYDPNEIKVLAPENIIVGSGPLTLTRTLVTPP